MRARDMDMRRGRVHAAGRRPYLSSAPLLRCTTVDVGEGILLRKDCASTGLRFAPLSYCFDAIRQNLRLDTSPDRREPARATDFSLHLNICTTHVAKQKEVTSDMNEARPLLTSSLLHSEVACESTLFVFAARMAAACSHSRVVAT